MNGLADGAALEVMVGAGKTILAWPMALLAWFAWTPEGRASAATLLGGCGLWSLLPGGSCCRQVAGSASLLLAAALLFSLTPVTGLSLDAVLFWSLAGIAISAAVGTVTSRSAVYSAIWFALALLGTGGLFLLHGAQFLGVATVAVYAGAIVVTFLFVLMLAQPEGHTFYDRISWGRWPSLLGCWAGTALASSLVWAVTQMELPLGTAAGPSVEAAGMDAAAVAASAPPKRILQPDHVAGLGKELFSRQLISVLVAGALLLGALVGALAMAAHHLENRAATGHEHARRGAEVEGRG